MPTEPMHDLSDIELQKTPPPPELRTHQRRRPAVWMAAVALGVATGAALFFLAQRGGTPVAPGAGVPAPEAAPAPDRVLGGAADPIDIPPLDQSDEVVRALTSALSSHPRVAAWLATNGLIRNFTVVVDNIANGNTPAGHLRMLRPAGAFRTLERGDRLLVDPRSYDRYAGIADAVASINADGAARLYSTLKPRIDEAYRELGNEAPFDRALERALVALLRVPILEGDVALEPQGAVYQFAEGRIEGMSPAQKQLARMGPRNVRVIQERLYDIALALGIPPEQLR